MTMMPLARTPLDKQAGKALNDYTKSTMRMLDQLTPWQQSNRDRLKALRGKVKSGTVAVLLDPGEKAAGNPLYQGAQILTGK